MKLVGLVALLLCVSVAGPAAAGLVRVDFAGAIEFVQIEGDESDFADLLISGPYGAPFSGSFTFDDTAAPLSVGEYRNIYAFSGPEYAFSTAFGEYAFGRRAEPWNDDRETHEIRTHRSGSENGADFGGNAQLDATIRPLTSRAGGEDAFNFHLELAGSPGSGPVMTRDIDSIPWTLSAFAYSTAWWTFVVEDEASGELSVALVWGPLSSLTATRVPEPGAALLCAITGVALAALGFRRARS